MLDSKAHASAHVRTEPTRFGRAQRSRDFELFEDLDPAVLPPIEQAGRYRRFSAQEQIIDRDAHSSDVFFIVSGRARVVDLFGVRAGNHLRRPCRRPVFRRDRGDRRRAALRWGDGGRGIRWCCRCRAGSS